MTCSSVGTHAVDVIATDTPPQRPRHAQTASCQTNMFTLQWSGFAPCKHHAQCAHLHVLHHMHLLPTSKGLSAFLWPPSSIQHAACSSTTHRQHSKQMLHGWHTSKPIMSAQATHHRQQQMESSMSPYLGGPNKTYHLGVQCTCAHRVPAKPLVGTDTQAPHSASLHA